MIKPRIVFFGSDIYSVIVLNQLVKDKRFKIVSVISNVPEGPVEKYAETIFETKFVNVGKFDEKVVGQLKKLKADVGILASFGKILPTSTMRAFPHEILNIHPSLLPKYRGPTPVPTAILEGEKETGVTIFKIDNKVDHGPIIAQFTEQIEAGETADEILKKLFSAGAKVLTTILPAYLAGKIEPRSQDEPLATYTHKFNREDGKINWKKSPEYLARFIQALHPWPGAWAEVRIKNVKRLKILKAHLEHKKLVLDEVQLEGKKPVTWKQFCEGYPEAKIVR